MKVVVTNTVVLNGGDAAILMAIISQVRSVYGPGTEVVVADTQPDIAKEYYPDLNFIAPLYLLAFPPRKEGRLQRVRGAARFARWYSSLPRLYAAAYALGKGNAGAARLLTSKREWESLHYYADADLIISTGGTYLVENYWLGPRIFDFRIALLLQKPLVLYTQSMGPFTSGYARRALPGVLKNAALILLRDSDSIDNVHALCDASDLNAHIAADAAFLLADSETLRAAEKAEVREDGLRIAVSVRYWPFFETMPVEEGMEAYLSAVALLTEHLVRKRAAAITFISTCQGVPGYAYDDSKVAAEVISRMPEDVRGAVSVDARFHRPDDLMNQLRQYDIIVATRMHMAVLGLAAGVPVLPVSYEFKTQSLFARLGMAEFVCDIEDLTSDVLIATLDRFIEMVPLIRQDLFRKVEEERRRALAVAEDLEVAVPVAIDEGEAVGGRQGVGGREDDDEREDVDDTQQRRAR